MRHISVFLACLIAFAVPIGAAESALDPIAGIWVQHEDSFDYFGLTSLFSCSSIEDHVKDILLHVGARKDAHVYASGCPHGELGPGRTAHVHAKFYTLAPAQSASARTVSAQWATLELSPRHPFFVGDGDCELIEAMKDFLPRNFSLRDVQYKTDCVPYQLNLNGFSVKAEVLKPAPVAKVGSLTR